MVEIALAAGIAAKRVTPHSLRHTRRFKKLAADAGVPVNRFHDIRHFAATVQLIDGAPINVVQQQLGHSKASTTLDIYAHITPAISRQQATRMQELLGGHVGEFGSQLAPNLRKDELSEP